MAIDKIKLKEREKRKCEKRKLKYHSDFNYKLKRLQQGKKATKKYLSKPENRNKYNEYKRIYAREVMKKNPKSIFYKYEYGAKARGLLFKLTFQEFMTFWGKDCFYCNNRIETIGLDRVDNDLGYLNGNVVACCSICNKMKQTFSKNLFIEQCNKITKKHPDYS